VRLPVQINEANSNAFPRNRGPKHHGQQRSSPQVSQNPMQVMTGPVTLTPPKGQGPSLRLYDFSDYSGLSCLAAWGTAGGTWLVMLQWWAERPCLAEHQASWERWPCDGHQKLWDRTHGQHRGNEWGRVDAPSPPLEGFDTQLAKATWSNPVADPAWARRSPPIWVTLSSHRKAVDSWVLLNSPWTSSHQVAHNLYTILLEWSTSVFLHFHLTSKCPQSSPPAFTSFPEMGQLLCSWKGLRAAAEPPTFPSPLCSPGPCLPWV